MKTRSRYNKQTELMNSHNNEFHSNAESKQKKEPFNKVFSIRGASTLFQGGEQNENRGRSKEPIRDATSEEIK
jgi:hypothetical protein